MKTILCLVSLVASLGIARAQNSVCVAATDACQPVVVQTAPVVCQTPVYQSPVYYAPYGSACYNPRRYSGASTVVHITGGRGTYVVSNYGNSRGSTVFHMGGQQSYVQTHY